MLSKILMLAIIATLTLPIAMAVNKTCLTNDTLQVNDTYYIDVDGTTTELDVVKEVYCPYGCTNNECEGSSPESAMSTSWIVYGTGTVLLILGTVLGIPFGKLRGGSEEEDLKKPFNTTIVIKYMFFFVGLFLVYMSMGMARRVTAMAGGEENFLGGIDASTMVMLITISLFLIVFVLEFVFFTLKSVKDSAERKKWGEQEM